VEKVLFDNDNKQTTTRKLCRLFFWASVLIANMLGTTEAANWIVDSSETKNGGICSFRRIHLDVQDVSFSSNAYILGLSLHS
jgi:hypothetical protein